MDATDELDHYHINLWRFDVHCAVGKQKRSHPPPDSLWAHLHPRRRSKSAPPSFPQPVVEQKPPSSPQPAYPTPPSTRSEAKKRKRPDVPPGLQMSEDPDPNSGHTAKRQRRGTKSRSSSVPGDLQAEEEPARDLTSQSQLSNLNSVTSSSRNALPPRVSIAQSESATSVPTTISVSKGLNLEGLGIRNFIIEPFPEPRRAQLGESGLELLDKLEAALEGPVFPASLQEELTKAGVKIKDSLVTSDDRNLQDLSSELVNLQLINKRSLVCRSQSASECVWDHLVNFPILLQAYPELRPVGPWSVMSSKIEPSYRPSMSSDTVASKIVDHVLYFEPTGASLSRINELAGYRGNINHITDKFLRAKPIVISIEVKSGQGSVDDGQTQLAVWLAAQVARIEDIIRQCHPPTTNPSDILSKIVFPLILVENMNWIICFGRVGPSDPSRDVTWKPMSQISISSEIKLADSNTIPGTYRLLKCLRTLRKWIDEDMRKWWVEVLNVDDPNEVVSASQRSVHDGLEPSLPPRSWSGPPLAAMIPLSLSSCYTLESLRHVGNGIEYTQWPQGDESQHEKLGNMGFKLVEMLREGINRVAIYPKKLESKLRESGVSNIWSHQFDAEDGRSLEDLTHELETIKLIEERLLACQTEKHLGSEWSRGVYGPLLELIFVPGRDRVAHHSIADLYARPEDDTPRTSNHTVSEAVNSVIYLSLCDSSHERVLALDSYSRSFNTNHFNYNALRMRPVAVSIETKTTTCSEDELKVKLARWVALQVARIEKLLQEVALFKSKQQSSVASASHAASNYDIDEDHFQILSRTVFPLIQVHDQRWLLFLAHVVPKSPGSGNRVTQPAYPIRIFGKIDLGNTSSITDTYSLLKTLRAIRQWIDEDMRKWWEDVLGVSSQASSSSYDKS